MIRSLSVVVLGAVVPAIALGQIQVPPNSANMSLVRVVHAASDAPAVDVLANGSVVFQGLNFKTYTDYIAVPPGTYSLQVNLTGTSTTVITSSPNVLMAGGAYTFYAVGTVAGKTLRLIGTGDEVTPPPPGSSVVRVVHAASTAPSVDVYVTTPYAPLAAPALSAVPFGVAGPYVTVPIGDYQGRVTVTGTKTLAIDSGRFTLTSGTVRTFVALDPNTPGGAFQLLELNDVN